MTQSWKFGTKDDGEPVSAYRLTSKTGFEAIILDQGAILQSLRLPNGRNVTLGFEDWESYELDTNYIGRIIGPNANRIANAQFNIGEDTFDLIVNDGAHNLHSGPNGYDVQSWTVSESNDGISLSLDVPNKRNNFLGSAKIKLNLSLIGNRLRLEINANCDRSTPMNMTWHPYWNLGKNGKIDGHNLYVDAELRTRFDTGESLLVKDTRFDFRKSLPIGSTRLDDNYKQVKSVILSADGVSLTVTSSLPDAQVYTGDALSSPRTGIAIEPQYQPNDINLSQDSLLRPGETYSHWIEYCFDVI